MRRGGHHRTHRALAGGATGRPAPVRHGVSACSDPRIDRLRLIILAKCNLGLDNGSFAVPSRWRPRLEWASRAPRPRNANRSNGTRGAVPALGWSRPAGPVRDKPCRRVRKDSACVPIAVRQMGGGNRPGSAKADDHVLLCTHHFLGGCWPGHRHVSDQTKYSLSASTPKRGRIRAL